MAGGRNLDLEALKMVFADKKPHIAMAKIKKISLAQDRSFLKCLVAIWPDQREVIARMTFGAAGPNAGIVEFPEKDDMVLVGFADGSNDYAFIIARLTSVDDKIPAKATTGDLVVKSKAGKSVWVTSNTKINLSKGDTAPTENLVLGQQLKDCLVDILGKVTELSGKVEELSTKISTHTHAGNLGYPTSPPNESGDFISLAGDFNGLAADFDDISSSPVADEEILSDLAFTEKG